MFENDNELRLYYHCINSQCDQLECHYNLKKLNNNFIYAFLLCLIINLSNKLNNIDDHKYLS